MVSMLDGMDKFISLCEEESIPATYFCLSDLSAEVKKRLPEIKGNSGEIAMHGTDHTRPMTQSVEEFREATSLGLKVL